MIESEAFPSVDDSTASAKRTALILALLTLLAALLRFWRLGDWSFWADEIATLRDSQNMGNVITYPVGYALIGFAVRLFGENEFAARLVPAIAGVISVPALYLIGRKLFSERAAVLSAVLLAFSSYHIFFSQEARYYSLVMLFGMLGMWCAFVGIERNSRKWLIGAVLLLALAAWTHWTAGLALAAVAAYALGCRRKEGRPEGMRWSNLAILFAPFIVAGILFARGVLSFLFDWQAKSGFSISRSALMMAKLADRFEPAALIFAAVAAWVLLQERDRRGKWLVSWALVPSALVVLFVGFAEGESGSRFGIVALPAIFLLAGEGLDVLIRNTTGSRRNAAWLLAGLVILSLGLKDGLYFTVERGQRPRWREAAEYPFSRSRPTKETPLVMTAAPAGPEVLAYYVKQSPVPSDIAVMPKSAGLAELKQLPKDCVCYVVVEMTSNARPSPELLKFLDEHGTRVKTFPLTVQFMDYSLRIYRLPAARIQHGGTEGTEN